MKHLLRTMTTLAEKVGQPVGHVCWAVSCGLLPAPDIAVERRRYYSPVTFRKAVACFNRKSNEHRYTLTKLAKLLNTTTSRLQTLQKRGTFPAPCAVRGERPVWNDKQLEQIRRKLPALLAESPKREPDGFYTATRAAAVLGMPAITMQSWIYGGKIAGPSHVVPGYALKFFNDADLENIRKIKSGYFAKRI